MGVPYRRYNLPYRRYPFPPLASRDAVMEAQVSQTLSWVVIQAYFAEKGLVCVCERDGTGTLAAARSVVRVRGVNGRSWLGVSSLAAAGATTAGLVRSLHQQ